MLLMLLLLRLMLVYMTLLLPLSLVRMLADDDGIRRSLPPSSSLAIVDVRIPRRGGRCR